MLKRIIAQIKPHIRCKVVLFNQVQLYILLIITFKTMASDSEVYDTKKDIHSYSVVRKKFIWECFSEHYSVERNNTTHDIFYPIQNTGQIGVIGSECYITDIVLRYHGNAVDLSTSFRTMLVIDKFMRPVSPLVESFVSAYWPINKPATTYNFRRDCILQNIDESAVPGYTCLPQLFDSNDRFQVIYDETVSVCVNGPCVAYREKHIHFKDPLKYSIRFGQSGLLDSVQNMPVLVTLCDADYDFNSSEIPVPDPRVHGTFGWTVFYTHNK